MSSIARMTSSDSLKRKRPGIEMIGVAVIAEVESEYIEAVSTQARCRKEHVVRFAVTPLSVEEHDRAARFRTGLPTVESLQAYAVPSIRLTFGRERIGGVQDPAATALMPARGREDRLYGRIARP